MVLDIHELTVVTDLFVICSGDNERLLRAISRDVLEAADKAGIDPRRSEGAPESGWILIDFDAERVVTGIAIANGYQKNTAVFRDNYRVRRLRLVSSNGESAIVNLADQEGSQRIALDRPLRGEWLQIVIEGVYSGAREPDLAISELRVISQPAH